MTSGKVVSPALSPVREKTETRGRAAILIVVNTFDPKVRSGQLTNCNDRCNRLKRFEWGGGELLGCLDGRGGRLRYPFTTVW